MMVLCQYRLTGVTELMRVTGVTGVPGGEEGIQGIPWGHRVGSMSIFMIHKAYVPVYK